MLRRWWANAWVWAFAFWDEVINYPGWDPATVLVVSVIAILACVAVLSLLAANAMPDEWQRPFLIIPSPRS